MLFELSIVKKYLIPKRKQLSVSLISILSVIVISLVVWLVLVFLSVTEGIEKAWIKKLTALNAPVRITPTQEYYSSYYYLIDSISSASNFTLKSIAEKAKSQVTDPYLPEVDMEIPMHWPKPFFTNDGKPVDLVKGVFSVAHSLKRDFPSTFVHDFEISGALMRLRLIRKQPLTQQSFLTQVSYLNSFVDDNDELHKHLLTPEIGDLSSLIDAVFYNRHLSEDHPDFYEVDEPVEDLHRIFDHLTIKKIRLGGETYEVSLIQKSMENAKKIRDIQFKTSDGKIVSLEKAKILEADIKTHFDKPPITPPLWTYFVNGKGMLPKNSEGSSGIILPKNYKDAGVKIGDNGYFSYGTKTASSFQEQRIPIQVCGFYDPGVMAIGARYILAQPELIHHMNLSGNFFSLDDHMNSGIGVWFSDLTCAKTIKNAIKAKIDEAGLSSYWKVTSFEEYDFAKDLLQQFQSDKSLFTLIGIIILTVACCNIISLLTLLVNDKKKEMGILSAMGAKPSSITLIFAMCGMAMGIISCLIGTISAYFTLSHIDKLAKFLSMIQGHEMFSSTFYGDTLPNTLSHESLFFIAIATPLIAFVAGLIPALKASKLSPTQILRSE